MSQTNSPCPRGREINLGPYDVSVSLDMRRLVAAPETEADVQALSDDLLRTLAFIDQAERGGARPSAVDVGAYYWCPEPEASFDLLGTHVARLGRGPFDVVEWMDEVGLIYFDDPNDPMPGVGLTLLGRAMLRGAVTDSAALMLSPKDPLAYPKLVARLSEPGTLVADPYIRLQQLHDLLAQTRVSRILMSSIKVEESELAGCAALLRGLEGEAEVRVSSSRDWHDRYLTSEDAVAQLGASINGLSKNVTALLPVTDSNVAQSIRAYVEELWRDAAPLRDYRRSGSHENGGVGETTSSG